MSSKIGAKFYRRTDVKMTLWYVFTFLISGLIVCGFLYFRMWHQLVKEVDRFLLDETKELETILIRSPNDDTFKDFERHVKSRTNYPIFFQVLSERGDILYISENLKRLMDIKTRETLLSLSKGDESRENVRLSQRRRPFRFISTSIAKDEGMGFIVQVGTHLKFVRKSLSNFKNNLLVALPIVLMLGTLGGWVLARKSLSPIGYITSKAESITSRNLNERLMPRGTGDEMDDLIRTINEMIARLENSFKRMAEFTADASHELKTPLCAMRGEAEVLLSKGRTSEEYQEALAHFIEEYDRLNQMIDDLILLSKLDSSQMEFKMIPLRLDTLIENIGDLFRVLAEQKNINFILGPLQNVLVMGDKMRLQQLFTNLIDNAIKFTPEGAVHITMEKNQEVVLVKIRDTGIGIPKEEQKNIFKRFYRVEKSRSRETGGVGLGLSISEWITQAHHGRIEVYSELNEGSTFTITLPILQV